MLMVSAQEEPSVATEVTLPPAPADATTPASTDTPPPANDAAEALKVGDGAAPPEAPVLEGLGQPIPQAYLPDRYSGTWNKNPFLIKLPIVSGPVVNPFADWVLTGLTIPSSGNATAFIKNRQTNDFKKVTTIPNEKEPDGFILKKANPNRDRRLATVEVQKGSETGTLQFDDTPSAAPSANALGPRGVPQPGTNAVPIPLPGQPQNNRGVPQPGVNPRPGLPQPGVNPRQGIPQPNNIRPGYNGQQPGGAQQQTIQAQPGVINVPRSPSSRRRILTPPAIPDPSQPGQVPLP